MIFRGYQCSEGMVSSCVSSPSGTGVPRQVASTFYSYSDSSPDAVQVGSPFGRTSFSWSLWSAQEIIQSFAFSGWGWSRGEFYECSRLVSTSASASPIDAGLAELPSKCYTYFATSSVHSTTSLIIVALLASASDICDIQTTV